MMSQKSSNFNSLKLSQHYKRGDRQFRRIYIACDHCRKQKARCELGGSDQDIFAFSGPPCARCRREGRECIFSEERSSARKRRKISPHSEQPIDGVSEDPQPDMAPLKILSKSHEAGQHASWDESAYTGNIVDLGGAATESPGLTTQRSPVGSSATTINTSSSAGWPNLTVDLAKPIAKAAEVQELSPHNEECLSEVVIRKVIAKGNDPVDLLFEAAAGSKTLPRGSSDYFTQVGAQRNPDQSPLAFINVHHKYEYPGSDASPFSPGNSIRTLYSDSDTMALWRSSRYVKVGLLSAEEAVFLIEVFFENLAPQTPILTDRPAGYSFHKQLLLEEPLLCAIILMISARYHSFRGNIPKTEVIHEEVWKHCQALIQRIMFGQGRISDRTLRSLSSIEGLLLLSEWYPRINKSVPSSYAWDIDDAETSRPQASSSTSNIWLEDILGPTKRADHMCWMLLGTAQLLAHELGIFTKQGYPEHELYGHGSQHLRKLKVQELLCIYITQTAARLGFHSMIAFSCGHAALSKLTKPVTRVTGAWVDLMKLTKSIHGILFSSETRTRDILSNQGYIELLEHFEPLLDQWNQKYLKNVAEAEESAPCSKEPLYDILFIEYHTVRMYTNSLSIQALTQQALARNTDESSRSAALHILSLNPEEEPKIRFGQKVISDATKILERAIALAQAKTLRFHPVRVFYRVIGASVFVLKGILLGIGSGKSDGDSERGYLIGLLQKTIEGLRISAVDEFHPAACYGVLLERHFTSIKAKSSSNGGVVESETFLVPQDESQVRLHESAETMHFDMLDPYAHFDLSQEFCNLGELEMGYDFGDYQF